MRLGHGEYSGGAAARTRAARLAGTAAQVMNIAIAMNWHVAAAHTKAWKTS